MRSLLILALAQGCYSEPHLGDDGPPAQDTMRDSMSSRTRRQLVGVWAFNDGSGTSARDTSGAGTSSVDLQSNGTLTWNGDGTMTVTSQSPAVILSSGSAPHLNSDC